MSPETLLETLVKKARVSKPAWPKKKPGPVGKWSPLYPIYKGLRDQGFTIREAVDWMIREKAVKEKDRKKGEYGLSMVDSRNRRASGIPPRKYRKRRCA